MIKLIQFIFLFIFFYMTTVSADTTVTLIAGSRNLNSSESQLPVFGISLQKNIEGFYITPEVTLLNVIDPLYGGNEYDISIGGVYNLPSENHKLFIGTGVSYFSNHYGANKSDGSLLYFHGGIVWSINQSWSFGFDARKSIQINSNANWGVENIGYFQTSIIFEVVW